MEGPILWIGSGLGTTTLKGIIQSMKSKLIILWFVLTAVLVFGGTAHAETTTIAITTNPYEDRLPQIKGQYVVWQGYDGEDWEIFLYDISSGERKPITENDYNDMSPQTDGTYVVWVGYNRTGGEVFLYRIGDPIPITNDANAITNDDNVDRSPQIADGRVAWVRHEVTDSIESGNIVLYDGGVVTQLSNTTSGVSVPRISNQGVAWLEPAPDNRRNNFIYLYDFETDTVSLAPDYVWEDPQSDGHLAVMTKRDGHDQEIYLYNRRLGSDEQVTSNNIEDRYPRISGNRIAWMGGEGQASEIFLAVYTSLALVSPEDGAVLSIQHPPTFSWEAIGYDRFQVEFSSNEDFQGKDTLTFPLTGPWLSETSFTPRAQEWQSIRNIERTNDRVHWRVQGKGPDGNVTSSETWDFTIPSGKGKRAETIMNAIDQVPPGVTINDGGSSDAAIVDTSNGGGGVCFIDTAGGGH